MKSFIWVCTVLSLGITCAEADYQVLRIVPNADGTPSSVMADVDGDGNTDIIKPREMVDVVEAGEARVETILYTEIVIVDGEDRSETIIPLSDTEPSSLTFATLPEGNYIGYWTWCPPGNIRCAKWLKNISGTNWTESAPPANYCPGVMLNGVCVASEPEPNEELTDYGCQINSPGHNDWYYGWFELHCTSEPALDDFVCIRAQPDEGGQPSGIAVQAFCLTVNEGAPTQGWDRAGTVLHFNPLTPLFCGASSPVWHYWAEGQGTPMKRRLYNSCAGQ